MSHLFDKRIVEAFGPLLGEVATEALPAAVKDALATPGLGDYLARTIDYIFLGGSARCERARVIADYSLASDHNPCEAVISVA